MRNNLRVAMFVFGALEYTIALTRSLIKHCQIDLYISRKYIENRDSTILSILDKRIQVYTYSNYKISDPRSIFSYYKMYNKLKKIKYNLIHFQGSVTPWMLIGYRILEKTPLIFTVHDPYQHPGLPSINSKYQDIMQRIYIHLANKIIVHGNILKKQFLKRYSSKSEQDVIVLPHGNFSLYKFWAKRSYLRTKTNSKKNILFFGSNHSYKGVEYLVKAESLIRKRLTNYTITLAGKGMNKLKEKFHLDPSRFRVVDQFIPTEKVHQYFNEASIVVLPYISATQSGIIPIAYAFGKPVIATNVGAIQDVVIHGKTGFIVPPQDEKAIAESIITLLTDDKLLKRMGNNAMQFSENQLSWEIISGKTANIYAHLSNI